MPKIDLRAMLFSSLAVTVYASSSALAAIYPNGTDLNQAMLRAQPYIAKNGGPSVVIETYKNNGDVISAFSGSLITSPDGRNRTVLGPSHGWFQALSVDPNARMRVLTGSNYLNDRGVEIPISRVLLAPGAKGTLDSCDLIAFKLPIAVPNTGQFVIGSTR